MRMIEMHLENGPFEQIRTGAKTIESRIYDEKRRSLAIGDRIVLINRANGQRLHVEIIELLLFPSFSELFASRDPQEFGGQSTAQLVDAIQQLYSDEEQKQNGVVGINFVLSDEE